MPSLFSFDNFPILYFLIGYCIAGLLGWMSVKANHWFYLGVGLFLLFFMRLPILLFNRELNVDEAQMLTQAMTLLKDPVYWRSVDGTTGGPLGSYFLIIPGLLLGNFSYITAHFGATILLSITLIFTFFALKNWFGATVAKISVYPAILFYSFTQYGDFVHYSSELVPVTLLAGIIYLFSTTRFLQGYGNAFWLGLFMLGMPFGKIQSIPLLAACIGYYLYQIVRTQQWKHLIVCVSSGMLLLGVLLLTLQLNGVFDDFVQYYISANFNYGDGGNWGQNLLKLPSQFSVGKDFILILLPLPFLLLFLILNRPPQRPDLLVFAGALILMGIAAVSRTGTGYTHYLFFLVVPFVLFNASLLATARKNSSFLIQNLALVSVPLIGLFLLVGIGYRNERTLNRYVSDATTNRIIPFSDTGMLLNSLKKPGDDLAVWGWNCQYYIESQLPQGVAENHTIRSVFEHPLRETYQKRYVADLIRNRPALFVDAVGQSSFWMQDKGKYSYESIPALKAFIDTNYDYVATTDDSRVFIRKDRK